MTKRVAPEMTQARRLGLFGHPVVLPDEHGPVVMAMACISEGSP